MNLFRTLLRLLNGNTDDKAATLDHVPVQRKKRKDWRTKALKDAAAKYGKPFKVGPQNLPHEVLGRAEPTGTVTPMRRKA